MKRLLLALLLALPLGASAQAILRNAFTTNANQTLGATSSSVYPLVIDSSTGVVTPNHILFSPSFHMADTNGFFAGDLSLSGRTNKLSIVNNQLYMDGVPVTSTASAPVNNFYATNIFVQNGAHNTLIITQQLTLSFLKTNVLATTASGVVTSVVYGSGLTWTPSTLTLSASGGGGGASVWIPNTALTYSGGTNLTIDGSGGTNFYVLLTNTAFFATPSNIPASSTTNTSFTVFFQQNATGTWDVTWTNASFKWPGGSQFKPLTNASSVSWVTFTMSPFTNGIFVGDYGVLDSR